MKIVRCKNDLFLRLFNDEVTGEWRTPLTMCHLVGYTVSDFYENSLTF